MADPPTNTTFPGSGPGYGQDYQQPPGTTYPPPVPWLPPYVGPLYPPQGALPGESGPDQVTPEQNPYTPLPKNIPSPGYQGPDYTSPQPGAPVYTLEGGGIGSIFGSYRRRFVKSKLTKSLEQAARRGLDAIFRAPPGEAPRAPGELSPSMQDAVNKALTRRGEPTRNVGVGPPSPPIEGGGGPGVGAIFRALVPGVTGIVGLAALLYPRGLFGPNAEKSDVGYGNPFQRDIDAYNALLEAGRAREQDRNLQLLMPPGVTPLETGLFSPQMPAPTTHRPNRVQRFRNRLERFETQFAAQFPNEIIPLLVNRGPNAGGYFYPGDSGFTPLPEGEKMRGITYPEFDTRPAPGEAPAPAPSPGKIKRQGPTGAINWPKLGLFAGVSVGTALLLRGIVGGNPYAGAPGAALAPTPATFQPPGNVAPGTTSSPTIYGLSSGNFGGSTGDCSCGPRGPRRKCLERAPVAWRSGRNKGKAAGSKCVRYAQRAS